MKKHDYLAGILLLIVFGALAYLPWVGKFGYYNDDWYLMYSARAYGPRAFWDIFSVDRPARALVMIPAYTLFRDNVLFYNLSAFAFRVVSAISLFWLLCMLWPRQKTLALWAALLFLLYPGFLSQPNGIDYQSQMVSLAAALLSIALSIKASLIQKPIPKISCLSRCSPVGLALPGTGGIFHRIRDPAPGRLSWYWKCPGITHRNGK